MSTFEAVLVPADQSRPVERFAFDGSDSDKLKLITSKIGCRYADAVGLPKADVMAWCDDDGLANMAVFNVRASWVTEHGGWGPLLGDVVFTAKNGTPHTNGFRGEATDRFLEFVATAPVLAEELVTAYTEQMREQANRFPIVTDWE